MARRRSRPAGNDRLSVLFRRIRVDAGISHGGEAGRRAGVTKATISRWESGKVVPTVEQAARYADLATFGDGARELLGQAASHYRQGAPT